MAKAGHIAELPENIADRIAAGEVIERPVSIVKELVENSIDAGSSSIVVEIRKGGKSYIRVTDNGSGIDSADTVTAFKRHATSKIRSASDLDSIATLGFRGEALASIAAVSRTELITKTEDERAGSYVLIEGGNVADRSEKGCPTGTTLVVRDLFYNTPARLKFMKSDNAESSLIIDLVSKIALAYPDIRVRMINNGSTLFSTPGRGDRLAAIATIYDPHLAKSLIRVNRSSKVGTGLSVDGYVSPPDITRKSRKNQIFFVNGRYVKNRMLQDSLSEAYRTRMFEGRYPVAFLFLSVDPAFTDVNIHPNKREIRFDDDALVSSFLTESVREVLMGRQAVPEIRIGADEKHAPGKTDKEKNSDVFRAEKAKRQQVDIHEMLRAKRAEETGAVYHAGGRPEPKEETQNEKNGSPSDTPAFRDETADAAVQSEPAVREDGSAGDYFGEKKDVPASVPFDVDAIKPVGIIFDEYILGSDRDTFYMIDQHAAHERIFYERLTGIFYSKQKASQLIAVPITLKTTFAAGSLADQWLDFLRNIGFAIEEFGQKTYIVREIPAYMDLEEAQSFLEDFTDGAGSAGSFSSSQIRNRIVTRACKSAVKANDRLSPREVDSLLKDLAACRNPFSCPHGRPTIIRMTHNEIDRMFKRQG